jgi:hypothetical protein
MRLPARAPQRNLRSQGDNPRKMARVDIPDGPWADFPKMSAHTHSPNPLREGRFDIAALGLGVQYSGYLSLPIST